MAHIVREKVDSTSKDCIVQIELQNDGAFFLLSIDTVECMRIACKDIRCVGQWNNDPDYFPYSRGIFLGVAQEGIANFIWFSHGSTSGENVIVDGLSRLRGWWSEQESVECLRYVEMLNGHGPYIFAEPKRLIDLCFHRSVVHHSVPGVRKGRAANGLESFCPVPTELLDQPNSYISSRGSINYPQRVGDIKCLHNINREISNSHAYIAGLISPQNIKDSDLSEAAAILETKDSGISWVEIPMRLSVVQRVLPRGLFYWPPSFIDGMRMEENQITIYFSDYGHDIAPVWKARWNPNKLHWVMQFVRRE